jgi:hypothetical protein
MHGNVCQIDSPQLAEGLKKNRTEYPKGWIRDPEDQNHTNNWRCDMAQRRIMVANYIWGYLMREYGLILEEMTMEGDKTTRWFKRVDWNKINRMVVKVLVRRQHRLKTGLKGGRKLTGYERACLKSEYEWRFPGYRRLVRKEGRSRAGKRHV